MEKKKMTDTDPLILYLSGAFDIGGCIKIETPKKASGASLFVWITYKSFKLMEILQKRGAHIGQKADGAYRAKWRDHGAYNVLRKLMPYLVIRKEQAKIALEFFEERERDKTPSTDAIFKLRLRLEKRKDNDEGNK